MYISGLEVWNTYDTSFLEVVSWPAAGQNIGYTYDELHWSPLPELFCVSAPDLSLYLYDLPVAGSFFNEWVFYLDNYILCLFNVFLSCSLPWHGQNIYIHTLVRLLYICHWCRIYVHVFGKGQSSSMCIWAR